MKVKIQKLPIALACVIASGFFSAAAADNHSLSEALEGSRAWIDARYRYEFVDQDSFDKDAGASTVRTRMGLETGTFHDISGTLEFEDVSEVGNDLYNSTINGRTDRPVVADPESTEVNQAYATISLIPDTTIKTWRYRLVLDNVRFIGDVGWRQNQQTYDGATLLNESIEDVKIFYGYIDQVNRIFGKDSPVGEFNSDSHLFNIGYSGLDNVGISLYGYLLDLEEAAAQSTSTYGGRVHGNCPLGDDEMKFLYDFEFAHQSDYEDNPKSYDVMYYRAEAGVSFGSFTVKAGFENLGSDDGISGFTTPLATLHKWNGWADRFLTTPDNGLQDAYGALIYNMPDDLPVVGGARLMAVYHYFQADEGSDTYGKEIDVDITKKFEKHFMAGVRFAHYNADDFSEDVDKVTFSLGANFSTS